MRKILLATSALVAFAGAAQAAESPITVNVGGYVDFRAAMFHESSDAVNMGNDGNGATYVSRRDHDFETEYRLNISAEGKAANGIEYGGLISLWNGADYTDTTSGNTGGTYGTRSSAFSGGGNRIHEDQAYVWMSGAWGKVLMGDEHGASDLFVYAPTVGEGQVDGTYTDFTDPTTLMTMRPSYIDNTENSTKLTYYTPKVGNANHKVQVGASYAPYLYDQGQYAVRYRNPDPAFMEAAYVDYVEGTVQYTGNWSPVNTVLSANIQTASSSSSGPGTAGANRLRDFTAWGIGAQAMYAGFTLGGSYVDAGRFGTAERIDVTALDQNKEQHVWSAGLKYENGPYALAVNGMLGEGYWNSFAQTGNVAISNRVNYVKDFSAIGFGATYTWFPGLTTAADAVFFDQQRDDTASAGTNLNRPNDGQVLMLSQKITF